MQQVDVRDKWQFTPLHSAANGGHVSTIRKLIQFSHEVDVKDYLGQHPLPFCLMQSCAHQHRCSVGMQVQHGLPICHGIIAVSEVRLDMSDGHFICGGLSDSLRQAHNITNNVQVGAPCIMRPCMGAWVRWKPW